MRWFSTLAGIALVALGLGASLSFGASTALPAITSDPTAVGAAVVGQRLTGTPGSWSGTGTLTYGYQWHRCNAAGAKCTSITGATSLSYKLVPKDVGQTLGLTVTVTDSGGSTSGYANLIGPISPANSLLVSTIQPAVTGTTNQGQALQVSDGLWSPKPDSVAYAWQRCTQYGRSCVPIPNATTNAYTAGADDVGHAIVALVSATWGETTVTAFSTTAAVVGATTTVTNKTTTSTTTTATTTSTATGAGPTETALPTITGSVAAGSHLAAGFGTWSGSGTLSYHYQWYRCDTTGAKCISVHGATGAGYKLVTADIGQTIGLTVTATDSSGKASGYANLIGPVAPAASPLTSTTQPTITGTAKTGQILLVSNGVWTSAPTSYTYSWQRCNANGRICAPIAGATATTYTLGSADVGHRIIAVVQAVFGTTIQAAFSTATAVVS
ncbi:MAG TPA: hypothetical protein VG652_10335 [Gaiellaceae bacterium]|nr:hypothetical protein [Gaiellaceae bacterium]